MLKLMTGEDSFPAQLYVVFCPCNASLWVQSKVSTLGWLFTSNLSWCHPSCLILSSAVSCCLFCWYLLFPTLLSAVSISQVVHKMYFAVFPCLLAELHQNHQTDSSDDPVQRALKASHWWF